MIGKPIKIIEFLTHQDKDKLYKIEEYKPKRSLDANAYFYVLQNKLAKRLGISNDKLHKQLLKDYGEIYLVKLPSKQSVNKLFKYYDKIATRRENGVMVNCYKVYLPSHEMDSKQMARLIDGVVMECKQQGIETLPPYKIKELVENWRAL